ncbi:MAG: 16S rRNA (uracil(1498)-N(3))-methyltransferase [Alphaproteobacteria bacterium]|nr:16S rRNA (uracil(1498)-N(3))-methyltransferase [Alphaproteobacteria bacterium]
MKNIPRIFVGENISPGQIMPITRDITHYLTRVMRTNDCLVFGNGYEYAAQITDDGKSLLVGDQTTHADPSNNITLMFAPIKRMDDLLNMATQMGVAKFQPVITARTTAHHINWERMQKIVIEASEQSNRNSVPQILPAKKFSDLDLSQIVFADERAAYGKKIDCVPSDALCVLVGPEGGFSNDEFDALDASGARGISLGKTILRAELAASIAIAKIMG